MSQRIATLRERQRAMELKELSEKIHEAKKRVH